MNNLHYPIRLGFFLLLLALMLDACDAHALDLLDAWHSAMYMDPTLGAARAGLEVGQKKSEQGKALKLPQVTLTAGAGVANTYNKISDAQFSAPGMGSASGANFTTQNDHGGDLRWNINLEQPLYNIERTTSARQLNKEEHLAEVRLGAEEQQLMLRVSKAYFDVLLAEDTLASIKSQRLAVSTALKIANERFKEGDLPIIDANEAQAREDALVSQELEADSHLQLSRSLLADLTGDSVSLLVRMPAQIDLQRFQAGELSKWVTQAQSNSPQFQIQQIHQDIAHDEIDKHRASNSPVLNLVAQAGGEESGGIGGGYNSGLSNHSFSVGMQLTIPIYTGGMRDAKLGEAVAAADQARYETEAIRLQAGQEARAAWLGVTVGQSKVKALEQALHSSQVKLDATRLGREVGDRTNLDVLNAETEYFSVSRELSQARYQLLLAMLGLHASVGDLSEKNLAEINDVLSVGRAQ